LTKVGFTVIIKNKATIVAMEEPTTTESKKGVAGPEFNEDHDHCFSDVKGIFHS
jgi:hypothetical protein